METGISKNAIIAELSRSPHGKLSEYVPTAIRAIAEELDFYSHLVAWNHRKGQIRDAKVALPVLGLTSKTAPEYTENSLAHLALLDPRNLLRAVKFARSLKISASNDKKVSDLVRRYLFTREQNYSKWERTALQHRATLKELYVIAHYKPSRAVFGEILFERKYPDGSVFSVLRTLGKLDPLEIAGQIVERKIPFLIAMGALGPKQKDPDVVMALMKRMSSTELVTNMKWLEKAGVRKNAALRAALEEAIGKAAAAPSRNTLKTAVAAEAVEDDVISEKLRDLQEKQIAKAQGIEGNWLVLADKSGSMKEAIETARHVAGTLAKYVKGGVALVFFDTAPRLFDATGKTYDAITKETQFVQAGGGTSIGCGLQLAMDTNAEFDGIALVSDGGENRAPVFARVYDRYSEKFGKRVPVYLYRVAGEQDVFSRNCESHGIDVQAFDLTKGIDYYALPNLVATMRTNRYGLIQEIYDTPLLTIDAVLPRKEEVTV